MTQPEDNGNHLPQGSNDNRSEQHNDEKPSCCAGAEPAGEQPQPGAAQAAAAAQAPAAASGLKWTSEVPEELLRKMGEVPPVARTKLDTEAMDMVRSKNLKEKESVLAEQLKAQANEPPKPCKSIDNYRPATRCDSVWNKGDNKERVGFCEQCKLQVYDFAGLDLPEAEEIIFNRENRRQAPLFKRADGKFLTSDCPVAVKRKQTLLFAGIGGAAILAVVFYICATLPPPPKPAVSAGNVAPRGNAPARSAPLVEVKPFVPPAQVPFIRTHPRVGTPNQQDYVQEAQNSQQLQDSQPNAQAGMTAATGNDQSTQPQQPAPGASTDAMQQASQAGATTLPADNGTVGGAPSSSSQPAAPAPSAGSGGGGQAPTVQYFPPGK
jgi:hypothetical protein